MKNKKKLIAIILIMLLAVAAVATGIYFATNGEKEPTLKETVEGRITAYETDLRDSLASMTDQKSVAKYLINWAENKGIEVKSDRYNNVVFNLSPTEALESKAPVVIVCGYDYTSMESYISSMVSALTIAKNDQPHGPCKIIFISEEKGSVTSAESLSTQYFPDNAQVFYLADSSSSRVAHMTGGYEQYTLSRGIKHIAPAYNKAYKITISGLPAQNFGSKAAHMPNPIKTLGNQLANFKSTSILFELASFSGGLDSNTIPSEASMTILINEDATAKLEKKLDNAIEKFYDKYQDKYPDVQYTYEVVETPKTVISTEDTESIISLLYTAVNGVHYKDDNGNIASLANIGLITTENRLFRMEAAASSYNPELLAEIAEAYQTTGVLAGVEYKCNSQYEPYSVSENNGTFEADFRSAYNDYKSTALENLNMPDFTPCGIIAKKNANMQMLILGVTERTKDNFTGGIITYLATTPAE